MPESDTQAAAALMLGFAERTGLVDGRPPRRYLWTDAFAVCNLLGLARATGEARYRALALGLIDQVHQVLGRHREDDPRSGWISGLGESEGEAHPTLGGLRIGKSLPERRPSEPLDERLEWERDGQYFHYLTQWMHALDQAARATGEARFNRWARELAERAQRAFTYRLPAAPGRRRMVWKMSIDLTRPLVASMGQHDPLDGFITCVQLVATAALLPAPKGGPDLDASIRAFGAMIAGGEWATTDPLGLGGLLTDGYRLAQLRRADVPIDERLLDSLLTAALTGLRHYVDGGELGLPAEYRLAFRELGLAIGLRAVELMRRSAAEPDAVTVLGHPAVRARLEGLAQHRPVGRSIEAFWRDPSHQAAANWGEHRDINEVMLATALAPEGFLVLAAPQSV